MPRAELLPEERRHRPARVAVVAPAVAELDLAIAAIEEEVRHARPRLPVGNLHLVARDPDVGHLVAVHALDPVGVERGGGEDPRVGRGLRGADVHRLLVAVATEVDDFPAQADLVLDALVEPEPVRAGLVVVVQAPVSVLLGLRAHPQLVERALEAGRDRVVLVRLVGEVGDEDDRDELLLGPRRDGLLRLGERLVGDAPAELLVPLTHALDLLRGRGEEAVDEGEARVAHQRVDDDLGETRVLPDLLRHLRREASFRELAHQIRNLAETEREQVRHVATLSFLCAVGTSQLRKIRRRELPFV